MLKNSCFLILALLSFSLNAMKDGLASISLYNSTNICQLGSMPIELKKESIRLKNENLFSIDKNIYNPKKDNLYPIKINFTAEEKEKYFKHNHADHGKKLKAKNSLKTYKEKKLAQKNKGKEIPYKHDGFTIIKDFIDFTSLSAHDMRHMNELALKIFITKDLQNPDSRLSKYLEKDSKKTDRIVFQNIDQAIKNNPTYDPNNEDHKEKGWRTLECINWALNDWINKDKSNREKWGKNYKTPLPKVDLTITEKHYNHHFKSVIPESTILSCGINHDENSKYMSNFFEENNKKTLLDSRWPFNYLEKFNIRNVFNIFLSHLKKRRGDNEPIDL